MQVLEQAVKPQPAALDDGRLAEYIHAHIPHGCRRYRIRRTRRVDEARVLTVQFRNIKGSGLDQYIAGDAQAVLYPPEYKDGDVQPFTK